MIFITYRRIYKRCSAPQYVTDLSEIHIQQEKRFQKIRTSNYHQRNEGSTVLYTLPDVGVLYAINTADGDHLHLSYHYELTDILHHNKATVQMLFHKELYQFLKKMSKVHSNKKWCRGCHDTIEQLPFVRVRSTTRK